ncbi:uncharacterized protein M6D78_012914 [Vipera latastei]
MAYQLHRLGSEAPVGRPEVDKQASVGPTTGTAAPPPPPRSLLAPLSWNQLDRFRRGSVSAIPSGGAPRRSGLPCCGTSPSSARWGQRVTGPGKKARAAESNRPPGQRQRLEGARTRQAAAAAPPPPAPDDSLSAHWPIRVLEPVSLVWRLTSPPLQPRGPDRRLCSRAKSAESFCRQEDSDGLARPTCLALAQASLCSGSSSSGQTPPPHPPRALQATVCVFCSFQPERPSRGGKPASRRSAMAQLDLRGWLLAVALSATLRFCQAGFPTIHLRDQEGPILEGNNVTLECLMSDGDNASDFTFQKYSKWLRSWISLDQTHDLRCWFYDVAVHHDNGRLLLTINDIQSWHAGPYRCASLNDTDNTTVSDKLDLQMEYLHNVFVSHSNSWCGTVGDSVTVLEGDNLQLQCSADASQAPQYEWIREGDDWILPSNSLTLSRITQEQAGIYTCQAHHPTLPQLTKRKSVHLLVENPKRSFSFDSVLSLSTPMLALAVALPAVLLLLLILVFAFLIPRHRAAVLKKMALEESGQRSPIYKGSLDSVPSIGGDTQPLVM